MKELMPYIYEYIIINTTERKQLRISISPGTSLKVLITPIKDVLNKFSLTDCTFNFNDRKVRIDCNTSTRDILKKYYAECV